jgi:hypothetical protein
VTDEQITPLATEVMQEETIEAEILRLHQMNCDAAQGVIQLTQETMERSARIGGLLIRKKAEINQHGAWLKWFAKHMPFSTQTADNYRMVYQRWEELKGQPVRNLTEAYRLLRKASKVAKDKVKRPGKLKVDPADFIGQTGSVPPATGESTVTDLPP